MIWENAGINAWSYRLYPGRRQTGSAASDLADRAGIEATAAGNRLVNLVRKGYVYRWERPRREGDLFVDPRLASNGT